MVMHLVVRAISASQARNPGPFPLESMAELTIGRDPAATLVFDSASDGMVSRRHAVIKISVGRRPGFRIADLGSRNGTIVNGRAIEGEQDIRPGDTIQVGKGGPTFAFDLHPSREPANGHGRQPPAKQQDGDAWPPYIEDLEAFAMEAAASGAWDHLVTSGRIPMRGAAGTRVPAASRRQD